jgi:hypothetical protein
MASPDETPIQAAIRGLEERAAAREAAAAHLNQLAETVGAKPVVRGLVVLASVAQGRLP